VIVNYNEHAAADYLWWLYYIYRYVGVYIMNTKTSGLTLQKLIKVNISKSWHPLIV